MRWEVLNFVIPSKLKKKKLILCLYNKIKLICKLFWFNFKLLLLSIIYIFYLLNIAWFFLHHALNSFACAKLLFKVNEACPFRNDINVIFFVIVTHIEIILMFISIKAWLFLNLLLWSMPILYTFLKNVILITGQLSVTAMGIFVHF